VCWGRRWLVGNGLTGTLPSELGNLDALTSLCVCRSHPPRLDACAVTGLWTERRCWVQAATLEQSDGAAAFRAG
jgi:hypothetical protein